MTNSKNEKKELEEELELLELKLKIAEIKKRIIEVESESKKQEQITYPPIIIERNRNWPDWQPWYKDSIWT